jgi:TetR/AcrR family transcriptional regulator, mexJK operon transcriptional repressor
MIAAQRRQEAKREQIRTAAEQLFLDSGFGETSMDAVTAAAGVSKQTLYRYYETKAALFADVLGQLIAEPEPLVKDLRMGSHLRTRANLKTLLTSLSQDYLARVLEPRQLALLRVVIAEGSRFPELTESFRSTLPAVGGAIFIAALERGRAAGLVAGWVDVRTAARAFAGLLMMFILRDGLLAIEPKLPSRQRVAEMVQIFVDGVGAPRRQGDG